VSLSCTILYRSCHTVLATSDDSDNDIPIIVIVGAAVGGVLAIVVLVIIIICLLVCLKRCEELLINIVLNMMHTLSTGNVHMLQIKFPKILKYLAIFSTQILWFSKILHKLEILILLCLIQDVSIVTYPYLYNCDIFNPL